MLSPQRPAGPRTSVRLRGLHSDSRHTTAPRRPAPGRRRDARASETRQARGRVGGRTENADDARHPVHRPVGVDEKVRHLRRDAPHHALGGRLRVREERLRRRAAKSCRRLLRRRRRRRRHGLLARPLQRSRERRVRTRPARRGVAPPRRDGARPQAFARHQLQPRLGGRRALCSRRRRHRPALLVVVFFFQRSGRPAAAHDRVPLGRPARRPRRRRPAHTVHAAPSVLHGKRSAVRVARRAAAPPPGRQVQAALAPLRRHPRLGLPVARSARRALRRRLPRRVALGRCVRAPLERRGRGGGGSDDACVAGPARRGERRRRRRRAAVPRRQIGRRARDRAARVGAAPAPGPHRPTDDGGAARVVDQETTANRRGARRSATSARRSH